MDNATILKMWNGFTDQGKDMSFAEFRKEMDNLTDPEKIADDLADIELQKTRVRSNKLRIDRALEESNGWTLCRKCDNSTR